MTLLASSASAPGFLGLSCAGTGPTRPKPRAPKAAVTVSRLRVFDFIVGLSLGAVNVILRYSEGSCGIGKGVLTSIGPRKVTDFRSFPGSGSRSFGVPQDDNLRILRKSLQHA